MVHTTTWSAQSFQLRTTSTCALIPRRPRLLQSLNRVFSYTPTILYYTLISRILTRYYNLSVFTTRLTMKFHSHYKLASTILVLDYTFRHLANNQIYINEKTRKIFKSSYSNVIQAYSTMAINCNFILIEIAILVLHMTRTTVCNDFNLEQSRATRLSSLDYLDTSNAPTVMMWNCGFCAHFAKKKVKTSAVTTNYGSFRPHTCLSPGGCLQQYKIMTAAQFETNRVFAATLKYGSNILSHTMPLRLQWCSSLVSLLIAAIADDRNDRD